MSTVSSAIANGNDSDADQLNNVRQDALEHTIYLRKDGAIGIANGILSTIVPNDMDVVRLRYKSDSGSGNIRIKSGATTVKNSQGVTNTAGTTVSIDTAEMLAGEVLTVDCTSSTSLNGLILVIIARRK